MPTNFVPQTVIIKKGHPNVKSRKAAMRVAEYHTGRASNTIRKTKAGSYRIRQRPKTCFQPGTFRTKCRGKLKLTCVTYGRLKPGARDRESCR